MKRGEPLRRSTPLQPRTELRRTSELPRGTPLPRTSPPLRSVPTGGSRTPGKAKPARDITPKRRQLVYDRDGGCARCGREVGPGQRQCHHRVARGIGGRVDHDRPSALITVCGVSATDPQSCHTAIERFRVRAQASGFLVPAGMDPLTWPVNHAVLGWVFLDDEGGWTATGPYGATDDDERDER